MNGILQLYNTGWMITAAKAFAGSPRHLLGQANKEAFKIIYKYIQEDKVQEYKGRMSALCTLQQVKARFQNQAFNADPETPE